MQFTGLTPNKIVRFGGQADWDDPTQIPAGLAIICQHSRFSPEGVSTRFGTRTTMLGTDDQSGDAVGFDTLNTLGASQNQVTLVYGFNGKLYVESPPGSGTLIPVTVPFILPANSYMQDSLANNQMYMSFSDLRSSTIPPFFYDGRTNNFDTIGQVPIAAPWKQGTYYKLGDLFKSVDGRWWRNSSTSGEPASGNVPQLPADDGFFSQEAATGTIATISWSNGVTTALLTTALGGQLPGGGQGLVFGGNPTAGFKIGDGITVSGVSLPFYNGVFTIIAVSQTTLQWLQAAPPPPISGSNNGLTWVANPLPATDGVTTDVVANVVGTFHLGDSVVVANAQDNFFNGVHVLTSVAGIPNTSQFALTWTQQQPTLPNQGPVSIPIVSVEIYDPTPRPPGHPILAKIIRITLNQNVPFAIGTIITFAGLTSATFLNGTTNTILNIPSPTQMEFPADALPVYAPASDTGTATGVAQSSSTSSSGGTVSEAATSVAQATGGLVTDNAATLIWNAATAIDDTGGFWEEWTPNVANQILAPEPLIATRNPGTGSLPAGKDIYVKTTFVIPATGETARSLPAILFGSVLNDQIILRAPRMPRWMAEINLQQQRFGEFFLNVYVAAVTANAAAPADSAYNQYSILNSVGSDSIVINTVPPGPDIQTFPLGANISVLTPNAPQAFIGEAGRRHMILVRLDKNGSPSPVDPDSVISVDFQGEISANIVGPNNVTVGSGIITIYLDDVSKFAIGQSIIASGLTNATYNATYTIVTVGSAPPSYLAPMGFITAAAAGAVNFAAAGTVRLAVPPPPPVAFLPPGGPNDMQDIAALTLVGTGKAGPFSYIGESDPQKIVSTSITALVSDGIAATVTVSDTTGFESGQTAFVSGYTGNKAYLNGIVQIASVSGSTVSYAQTGSPVTLNGTSGITLTVMNLLPTSAPAASQTITNIIRDDAGNVTASLSDIGGFDAGHIIQAASVGDATFNGIFQITSTQLNDDGFSGTLGWTQLGQAAATSAGGIISSVPDFVLNFQDEDLKGAISGDTDVTSQLTAIPPPACVDIAYLESLRRVVYTKGNDSSHYFSDTDDPGNIQSPNGILGINSSDGKRTIAIREMLNGEIISFKESGGFALEPNDVAPNQWTPTRRWRLHAPVGPRAIGIGPDWLMIFSAKTGPWRYYQGQLLWVGRELTGTWKRVNWAAKKEIWIEVDEDQQKAYIGLPLDGSTTCNFRAVVDYFDGWNDPITLYRGERVANPFSRRWSVEAYAARYGKMVDRQLAVPVNTLIDDKQMLFGMGGNSPLRIRMEVPDSYNDDGEGIEWQYQPAYAYEKNLKISAWIGLSGRAIGNGDMVFRSVVAVPEAPQQSPPQKAARRLKLRQDDAGNTLPTPYYGGERITTDLLTYNVSNDAVPDAWGELQEMITWYDPKYDARPGENLVVDNI